MDAGPTTKLISDRVLALRLPAEMLQRIDALRRSSPEIPTRSAIVRQLIVESLNRRPPSLKGRRMT
jgi:metal-responsive CopG/Arc/MetJ family transcriptional regulator